MGRHRQRGGSESAHTYTRTHAIAALSCSRGVRSASMRRQKGDDRRLPGAFIFLFSQHPGECTARVRASRDLPKCLLPRGFCCHEIRNRLRSCSSTFVVFHEESRMETRGLKKEIINFRKKNKCFFVCKVVLFMMHPTKKTYDCVTFLFLGSQCRLSVLVKK